MKEQTRLQWWEWMMMMMMMMMMIILMRIDVDDDNDEDDEDEDDADVSRDLDVNDHGFGVMEWKRNEECCRESVNFHLVLFCEQTIPWSNKRMMIHQFFLLWMFKRTYYLSPNLTNNESWKQSNLSSVRQKSLLSKHIALQLHGCVSKLGVSRTLFEIIHYISN